MSNPDELPTNDMLFITIDMPTNDMLFITIDMQLN
jgi:hypothetical protein